jgi:hypothetical protein
MPAPTQVERARVDTELRALADDVSKDLSRPWAGAVRQATLARHDDLNDRLDRALGETDLGADRIPVWAGLVRVLQYVLIISALVGAAWLALLAFGSYARLPEPPTPEVWGFPLPTLLLLGGVLVGVLLALVCRWLVSRTAKSRARRADKRLRDAISEVSAEVVVAPIQAELASYAEVREALAVALR